MKKGYKNYMYTALILFLIIIVMSAKANKINYSKNNQVDSNVSSEAIGTENDTEKNNSTDIVNDEIIKEEVEKLTGYMQPIVIKEFNGWNDFKVRTVDDEEIPRVEKKYIDVLVVEKQENEKVHAEIKKITVEKFEDLLNYAKHPWCLYEIIKTTTEYSNGKTRIQYKIGDILE